MASILIIEDEVHHCESLRQYLSKGGHQVSVAGSAEQALELATGRTVDAVLLDVRLPGLDGLSAIPRLRERIGNAPIIVMTAFGTLDTAAAAVEAGVFEYLVKPFSLKDLKLVLGQALAREKSAAAPDLAAVPAGSDQNVVIGRSPIMQRIFNQVALAAKTGVPILLTGESGTGKEVLARAVHRYSGRREQPFVPVFLAALSPTLIESELFGHTRGAYTGADLTRSGLFEQASGGTVLLDELGDIPLPLQVKLLRAIEQKEITRVGEDVARPIDVRFIAATNRSLPELIRRGLFREDLFYRLSVYHIELPPLRERREDIPELACYFLQRVADVTRCPGFTAQAMLELESRPWVGNIRELRNVVEHAAIASRGSLIAESHLPPSKHPGPLPGASLADAIRPLLREWLGERLRTMDPLKDSSDLHSELLREMEPAFISLVLDRCRGNNAAACRVLGLDPKTLKGKLGGSGGPSRSDSEEPL